MPKAPADSRPALLRQSGAHASCTGPRRGTLCFSRAQAQVPGVPMLLAHRPRSDKRSLEHRSVRAPVTPGFPPSIWQASPMAKNKTVTAEGLHPEITHPSKHPTVTASSTHNHHIVTMLSLSPYLVLLIALGQLSPGFPAFPRWSHITVAVSST